MEEIVSLDSQDRPLYGEISLTRIIGVGLVALSAAMLLWVAFEAYQMLTHAMFFDLFEAMIPQEILIADLGDGGVIYLPRELLVFGVPIWLVTLVSTIGLGLLRAGMQYLGKK
jgi:hypothetical protein